MGCEDGELAGRVGVQRPCGRRFRGVVDGEPGPQAVRMIAHPERASHEREHQQAHRAQRQDRRNRIRRILIVGLDGAFGRNDRGNAAHGRADREQADQFRRELERASERGHDGDGQRQFEGDTREAHASQLDDVAQHEPHAQQDDADFQPELVGVDARAKDRGDAGGVRHDQAEDDGPQDVLVSVSFSLLSGPMMNTERTVAVSLAFG